MSRTALALLALVVALPLAACKSNEELSRERCAEAGVQPGTPAFDECMRDQMAWRQQNRALQNRIYTN